MKDWKPIFCLAAASIVAFHLMTGVCSAEEVQGAAPIIDGNIDQARMNARNDAMRTCVERKVGVHVKGSTEVADGMVLSDHILAQSDGYVQINAVKKEWQSNGIYYMILDLDASDKKIETALADLKSRIEANISDPNAETSRTGIEVAVTGVDQNGQLDRTTELSDYVQRKLQDQGFITAENDAVLAYMGKHIANLNDPGVRAEIRRVGVSHQVSSSAKAILRGTINTKAIREVASNQFLAEIQVSFELIGYDSDVTNVYSEYFSAVGPTADAAFQRAKQLGTQAAVEDLAKKALRTVQMEKRGGVTNLRTTVVVDGITNRNLQLKEVVQLLQSAGCKVLRFAFTRNDEVQIAVAATKNYETLQMDILNLLPASNSKLEFGVTDANSYGSSKMYLNYKN